MSPPARRPRIKTLAELVPGCMSDALAAQGFASSEIITNWTTIVGRELGERSEPVKLQWPARGAAANPAAPKPSATLLVRVESAFVLELQHSSGVIIERINRYFGWACVGALRFRQGPVTRQRKAPPRPLQADPDTRRRVAETVGETEDPRLGEALRRLGEAVATRRGQ
jgi:hypothetical protein